MSFNLEWPDTVNVSQQVEFGRRGLVRNTNDELCAHRKKRMTNVNPYSHTSIDREKKGLSFDV
jgi:hypothetical protein